MTQSSPDPLDWIVNHLTSHLERTRTSPAAVLLLIRRYAATGHAEMRPAIEDGLTAGLQAIEVESDPRRRCRWLGVLAEAAAVSDDERIVESIQRQLAPAIDGLERLVRSSYEPGEGITGAGLGEHLGSAAAFLTAFELTGRLPYSMLAEELWRFARRQWWSGDGFGDNFGANAIAVQVLCRLAALHDDAEYAASAVVAPDANYAEDAERILTAIEPIAREHVSDVDEYGMALVEWFALRQLPN